MKVLASSLVVVVACSSSGKPGAPGGGGPSDPGPLALASITPALGSVAGGTRIALAGDGFSDDALVTIGDAPCTNVRADSPHSLACTTGSTDFHEGAMDVVVSRAADRAVLPGAYTYQCPWTTTRGRRSCGAVPPGFVAPQPIAGWITQFQDPQAYAVSSPAARNLSDTSDFVLGAQSISFDTDGTGAVSTLERLDTAPLDFTDSDLKLWVKVDNVAHLGALDVWLGDSRFANVYKFRLRSTQAQQFMTDGDWVSFTVPWSPDSYAVEGTPNRGAITNLAIRAADDGTGNVVRVHLNGLAMVAEPVARFPHGVVSYTFDDDWATAVTAGAPILAAHGFPATAYVIVDTVGVSDRATLGQLHGLQAAGWDVAVHANTDEHHFDRYPSLTTAEVEDDIVDARAWLIGNGFTGYDHCAYPGGDFTGGGDVLGMAGRYFASCRTIFEKQRETFPPSDPHKLRVLLVTNPVTLATVEQMVDDARQSREWLILVFHKIGPSTTDSIEWSPENFSALADYVAASGMPVQTVTSVLAP